MRTIILAAGSGTRMGKYTENLPKGMLSFNGKPLIEWQIKKLRDAGIEDIVIITGYKNEAIKYSGVRYFHNPRYVETNMVESLICAREILNTDTIVAYSDILYTKALIELAKKSTADIGVCVDGAWREYWRLRYGTTENDLESLSVSKQGEITELGKPLESSAGIEYRYIGLNKFSKNGISALLALYDRKKAANEAWKQSGKPFLKGYMTDILNELIQSGRIIKPIITHGGWMEFDTVEDYEIMCGILEKKGMDRAYF
jgi:choline kinase